jgi:YidC/Oxa1 family membrane protein insertase
MTPAAIGPAAIRFNSTSSNQPPTEIADKATNSEWSNTSELFDITTIPERIGYLKELGLDYGWGPSSMIQWLIEHTHIWTGMPWWASIVAAGIFTRMILLKPVMDAASMGAKMRNVKEETDPIRTRMVEGTRNGNQQDAQLARAELAQIHKREGIVAWKSFIPMLQIPLGYGTFRVVRGMTGLPVPAVASESVAWINDLTIADPTYLLPVMSAAMLMVVLRVSSII